MTSPGIPSTLDIKSYGNSRYKRRTAWYFANVPLNMIHFESWEPNRYVRNKELKTGYDINRKIIWGGYPQ